MDYRMDYQTENLISGRTIGWIPSQITDYQMQKKKDMKNRRYLDFLYFFPKLDKMSRMDRI